MPGWLSTSYGYHGDDGNIYHAGNGKSYGPTFATGDVIGCYINLREQLIFYTRNGQLLDVAFTHTTFGTPDKSVREDIYPMIALYSPGEHVRINFGKESFVFNITDYVERFLKGCSSI
jgi:Ran-binding protein 9/10